MPRYDINSIQFKFNRNDVNDRTVIGIEPGGVHHVVQLFPRSDGKPRLAWASAISSKT